MDKKTVGLSLALVKSLVQKLIGGLARCRLSVGVDDGLAVAQVLVEGDLGDVQVLCYADRNKVERFSNRLKQYRRLATRYDKTAGSFLAFAQCAATLIWLL